MALIVQKYGGTSVGTVERIKNVARRVAVAHNAGNQVVVVLSAMSGETNRLVGLANEANEFPVGREYDVIVSTGEQVTIALLALHLQSLGYKAQSFLGHPHHSFLFLREFAVKRKQIRYMVTQEFRIHFQFFE